SMPKSDDAAAMAGSRSSSSVAAAMTKGLALDDVPSAPLVPAPPKLKPNSRIPPVEPQAATTTPVNVTSTAVSHFFIYINLSSSSAHAVASSNRAAGTTDCSGGLQIRIPPGLAAHAGYPRIPGRTPLLAGALW